MVEIRRLSLTDPGSNKFINVRTKIKNPVLGNERAWDEAQPLLAYCDEDYPKGHENYIDIIRQIFCLRRDAFLKRLGSDNTSEVIQRLVQSLEPEVQEKMISLIACVRDFFDIPAPKKKSRGF